MKFLKDRTINVITVGRANVDFYPSIGEDIDQARHYDVFVGGSPANIAAGIAKLGLKSAIITRVADDLHGRFVKNYLSSLNIDTSQIQFDTSGAKTSLAFAERKAVSRLCMYRNNVADLLLNADDVDDNFVASSQSIVVTGFAFTQEPSRSSNFALLKQAAEANTIKVMDIDYRPYNWASLTEAAEITTKAAHMSDILLGTRAEFEVAGAQAKDSDHECAQRFIDHGAKLVVLKRDKDGSSCFTADGRVIENGIFPVQLLKPWGAGDAFASGFLGSLIEGLSIEESLQNGAASASINISGTSCTEAMPTKRELEKFIEKYK